MSGPGVFLPISGLYFKKKRSTGPRAFRGVCGPGERSAAMPRSTTAGTFDETAVSAKKIAGLVYLLQGIGLFIGITYVVAVVINYVKASEVKGTWIESHFRWQMRTFWFSLLWAVVGILTYILLIGPVILFADGVWVIYRIIKGALYLRDNKAMYGLEA